MGRPKRVLSFMSQWGGAAHLQKQPPSTNASPGPASPAPASPTKAPPSSSAFAQSATALDTYNNERASPSPGHQQSRSRSDSRSSRPMSMIQTYQPPVMEVSADTLPELQRIFTFLNSHSNKLYQEGYFLKFHDTDTRGRPAPDRKWQEYFVQLVGTILSLWDASALDHAGGDTEVLPTFINLTDAAIHMIPTMTLKDGKKLDNILSVSTAASNKYLFHFDSYHALTQWTAGIRLAMFEHTSLSESYTGALIAGKGKTLNNIRALLDRQCAVYDDWVRVRFGAGTPWRRCWCVVSPPDQKEYAKLQKTQKKANVYERPTILKGDIKFYDSKKIKKNTKPIATVKDAYSCYAIYPHSKPLIDQSTLVKIEGKITVHSNPETTTEGFVFVMPESRPAITGFEIMLQYLFPVFDTFNLYGRPNKLVADVLDTRGLMFAMPPNRRYGWLEIWDVVSLINTDGSSTWSERQWRKQLKDLTSLRMQAQLGESVDPNGATPSRRNTVSRAGFASSRASLRFEDQGSIRSSPSTRQSSPTRAARFDFDSPGPRRSGTAPPVPLGSSRHQRSVSEANGHSKYQAAPPRDRSRQDLDMSDLPPAPPAHGVYNTQPQYRDGSDSDESPSNEPRDLPQMPIASGPPRGPVDAPPALAHGPYQQPPIRPTMASAMKPNADVDSATLQQMADVSNQPFPGGVAAAGAAAAWRSQESIQSRRSGDYNTYGDNGQQMYLSAPSRPPPTDRNSGSRLATIPASPYVEHAEFVQPSGMYQPTAPPVPEHAQLPHQESRQEIPHRPHSGSGSGQVQRKPVPGRSPSASQEDDARSTTSSSTLDSLRNDIVDMDALDALMQHQAMLNKPPSASSSIYEDDARSATPDYASVASEEIQPRPLPSRSADRPRSGILRIAGDPDVKIKSDLEDEASRAYISQPVSNDVPAFDFGPTYVLPLEAKRPGTSGTMTQETHDGSFSRSRENLAMTPNEQKRQSYISGRTTPNATLHMRGGSGSPNVSDSRSVAWQPVTTLSQQQQQQQPDRQTFDPEEWVKYRAAHQPQNLVYGHGRNNSHTPPPLGGRQRSGDWAHLPRTPEGLMGSGRPQSRGAEAILDQRSTTLSAFEQEQAARMTNTTLLTGVTGHKKRQPSQGLTGYIDYREKEKAAAKHSRSGHTTAMQAEIDRRLLLNQQKQMAEAQVRQRQMVEMQQQQQQQMQASLMQNAYAYGSTQYAPGNTQYAPSVMGMSAGSPSVMGMPSGPGTPMDAVGVAYSSPQQFPQQIYQQQGYFPQAAMTPNTNLMPGGWGAPSPQGQYFPQQQQQMQYGHQQQPATQPYGASFDQAQAAAYARQQRR